MTRRRVLRCAAGLGLGWAVAAPLRAATPRTLWLTVAYPPGGVSDDMARQLADRLAPLLGQPVQVTHRPGAGGAVALQALSRASPDGQALCWCAVSTLTVRPWLADLRFDPATDIAPVAPVIATPLLVVGTPALAAADLPAALAAADHERRTLRWASSGQATTGHLAMEQVRRLSGAHIAHVPYAGGGQQISDALGGQFELLSTNVARPQLALLAQGRLRALAVGAPARLAVLPQVPTLAELGFAPANLWSVFALFAPGATPAPLLDRLNSAVQQVLQQADLRALLGQAGNLPLGGDRAAFALQLAQQRADNRALLQPLIDRLR